MTAPLPHPEADPEPPRDAVTTRMLVTGHPDALQVLLQSHGGLIRARLQKGFGKVLDDSEIDEVMSAMLIRVWNAAPRYDATKGSLRSWVAVIARNCALRLLERRRGSAVRNEPDLDQFVLPGPAIASPSAERQRLLSDLHACIDELPRLQRAVLIADLEAGGAAPAEPLARAHGTTANSIYVSRQKARKALRHAMARLGHAIANDRPAPGNAPARHQTFEPRSEHG